MTSNKPVTNALNTVSRITENTMRKAKTKEICGWCNRRFTVACKCGNPEHHKFHSVNCRNAAFRAQRRALAERGRIYDALVKGKA